MTRWGLLTIAVVAGAALSGCTAAPSPEPTPTPTPPVWSEPTVSWSPTDLLGSWAVADGEDAGAVLSLVPAGFDVTLSCGNLGGTWVTLDGGFAAQVFSGSQECFMGRGPTIEWLDKATTIAPTDGGLVLTDETGSVTATLVASAPAAPTNSLSLSWPYEPEVYFAEPKPFPSHLTPGDLHGRWIPDVTNPGQAYLEFGDTTWTSSDGCNGSSGRWLGLPDGRIIATLGATTLIGCDNISVESWLGQARSAVFDGDKLYLVDASGVELGRLARG